MQDKSERATVIQFLLQDAPPNCVKMILGSKCDLAESRAVSTELGKEVRRGEEGEMREGTEDCI